MSRANEWPIVKLGEVAEVLSGGTPKTSEPAFWDGDIPWITPADMSKNSGLTISQGQRSISEDGLKRSSAVLIPAGSVVLSSRAPIGYVAVNTRPLTTNQGCKSFVPGDDLDAGYLAHYLTHIREQLQQMGTGATFKELSRSRALEIPVPLPPLAEQQRIADVLNQTTSILEFARQEVRKIDESRSALFESLFPASNYPASTIGNFLSETQYGSSKKSAETGKYPMLRMGNLSSTGSISYSDLKYLNLEKKEINKYTLRNHDILFNRTNSKELVGKTAVYYGEDDQIAYAGYLIRCRTNDLATPEFISGFLNSRIGKAQLFQRAKAIVGMANINAKELRTLRIPAVPVEEQEKYTSASRQLENLRLAVEKKVEKLEELQQSLSTRAFAGQL